MQGLLFEEDAQADLMAIEKELDALNKSTATQSRAPTKPKRRSLPFELPRVEIYHEPEHTQCNCGCALKRIGEDVTEKLDYIPGKAQVERPIRGKWVCKECETLTQKPMPAHIINKGIARLNAVVYDFTPSRAGVHARAFLADWQGKLVTDDYSGYKQSFKQPGMTEIACMAHARRKFYELHIANKSDIAAQALQKHWITASNVGER